MAEIKVDVEVLLFAFALSLLTGILFSLAPLRQALRLNLLSSLRGSGSRALAGRARLKDTLVVVQIGLALMLLIGSALLIASFVRLLRVDSGFNADNLLIANVLRNRSRYPTPERWSILLDEIVTRTEALADVQSVAASTGVPLRGVFSNERVTAEGKPVQGPEERVFAYIRMVTPGYFQTIGVGLEAGRTFDQTATADSQPVAVVNRSLARRLWPGERPLGKKVLYSDTPYTVIGVVQDVKQLSLRQEAEPELFLPVFQGGAFPAIASLVVRGRGDARVLIPQVREQIRGVDKNLVIESLLPMGAIVSRSVAEPRFYMTLMTGFAFLACLLAAVGIFGVVSYSVRQRTYEIGIRMAVGAQRGDVLRLVLGKGMLLTLIGIAAGLAGALATTRALSHLLFGLSATDTETFAGASLFLAFVAFFACYLPARRATKVDPMVALRYE